MSGRTGSRPWVGEGSQPHEITPQLATAGGRLEPGDWFFERKLDGMRCLIYAQGGHVRLRSRHGRSYADRLPHLSTAGQWQASGDLIADGELVSFEDGSTSFPHLQRLLARGATDAVWLYIFDLLWLAGRDLRPLPLSQRKPLLDATLSFEGPLRLTAHQLAAHDRQDALLAAACEQGWEGLIAKRPMASYRPGRSRAWRKLPCLSQDRFVVGGWTPGRHAGFGALLLGRTAPGGLSYVGKVGSGFDARHRRALEGFFERIDRRTPAFVNPPDEPGVHWVAPVLPVLVEYLGWTPGGRLRQPRFLSAVADPTGGPGRAGTEDQP